MKTAEEILKGEMPENLWTFICSYPVSYKSEEKLVEWIIDAMQEYAAQFKAEKEKPIINLINNIECFAQILGKHCVDNKVSLTSNERHTIYDAFKEYIFQIEAEQEKVTDELVFKWLKDRKYQTSYGEQEYKMYFDVDMPKIIREAINHFTIEKVTDEDIDYFMCEVIFSQFDSYWDAMKYGAKAMRDGLITHNK